MLILISPKCQQSALVNCRKIRSGNGTKKRQNLVHKLDDHFLTHIGNNSQFNLRYKLTEDDTAFLIMEKIMIVFYIIIKPRLIVKEKRKQYAIYSAMKMTSILITNTI